MDATLDLAVPGDLARLVAIDDAATALFEPVGLALDLPDDHPFVVAGHARWARSLALGRTFVARDARGAICAFAVLDIVDHAPYLEQLSVHPDAMRRGLGRRLLHAALAWARARGGDALWLTTYAHVAWNAPFYAREGFAAVPEAACGPELRQHLAEERRALPAPEQRIAMRRALLYDDGTPGPPGRPQGALS